MLARSVGTPPRSEEVERIIDEAFLLALGESDEQMRRWHEEPERRRRGEFEEPVIDHRGRGLWGHLSPEARKEAMEQSVHRTIAMYDGWALETFGRVGRDPARITPFLRSLAQIWLEHPGLRFGELVCSGLPLEAGPERPGDHSRVGLPFLEEEEFLRLLREPGSRSGEEIYQAYASRGPLGDLMDRIAHRRKLWRIHGVDATTPANLSAGVS